MPRPFLNNNPENDIYFLIQEHTEYDRWEFFRNINTLEQAQKVIDNNPETKLRVIQVIHEYHHITLHPTNYLKC